MKYSYDKALYAIKRYTKEPLLNKKIKLSEDVCKFAFDLQFNYLTSRGFMPVFTFLPDRKVVKTRNQFKVTYQKEINLLNNLYLLEITSEMCKFQFIYMRVRLVSQRPENEINKEYLIKDAFFKHDNDITNIHQLALKRTFARKHAQNPSMYENSDIMIELKNALWNNILHEVNFYISNAIDECSIKCKNKSSVFLI